MNSLQEIDRKQEQIINLKQSTIQFFEILTTDYNLTQNMQEYDKTSSTINESDCNQADSYQSLCSPFSTDFITVHKRNKKIKKEYNLVDQKKKLSQSQEELIAELKQQNLKFTKDYLSLIVITMEQKHYYLKRFLTSGGQSDIFQGYHQSEGGKSQDRVFKIIKITIKRFIVLIRSSKIKEGIYPPNHPKFSQTLHNIGQRYAELGKPQTGLSYQLKSLEIRNKFYQGNNLNTAQSLDSVGERYAELKNYQKALTFQKEALEMHKALLKGNHIYIASSLENVRERCAQLDQKQVALTHQLQALKMYKKLFHDDNYHKACCMNSVVNKYQKQLAESNIQTENQKTPFSIYSSSDSKQQIDKQQNEQPSGLFEESSQDSIIDLGTKISKCTNLKILDLDLQNNSILEKDVLNLFNAICTCGKLEQFRLVIAENRIGLLGTEILAQNIQKLQNLQYLQLNIQGTNQTNKSIFFLVDNLSRCSNLKTFALMLKNNMIEDGVIQIAKSLQNSKNLNNLQLNVSFNFIKGCDFVNFGQEISKCSNLAILSLAISGNKQISLNDIEDSLLNISKLPQLQDFSLNIDGLIGGQSSIKFDFSKSVKNLLNCQNLTKLNLSISNNNITNTQLENIAAQLQPASNLENLQLKFENNTISDQGFIKLSQSISHLNRIKVLKLNFDRNQIKQNGINSFAESIKLLKDLQSLELSIIYNYHIGESLQILAQNIQNISNLKYVKLDINQCLVEASQLQRFATILSKCRQLQVIALQFNFPIQNIKARKQIITKLKKAHRLVNCN
ncbi:hypothetical protein ABPG72_004969 [Tetrahymena utriculariae]